MKATWEERDDHRPDASLPTGDTLPDLQRGSILCIGTATVLLGYAGFTILTDPTFLHRHEKVYLGYGLRSVSLTDPAVDIAVLPRLDLVAQSHLHEDHFDRVAERELDKLLPIVTPPPAACALRKKGFAAARALENWESLATDRAGVRLRITSAPGRHGPGLLARLLPQVSAGVSSRLEFRSSAGDVLLRLYITGDTLLFDELREIPARYAARGYSASC